MIEKQQNKRSSYFQLSFVDQLISDKLRSNKDQPIYQKFQDDEIRIYKNSLLKLVFAPFLTFTLTCGCFSIWAKIRQNPGSIIGKLTRLLRIQRATNPNFISNPYTQLAKNNKQANFNKMEAKFTQGLQQNLQSNKAPKLEKVNLQEDPRSVRYKNYKLQEQDRTRGSGDLRKQLQAIGFLKSRKVTAQLSGQQLIAAQKRATQRRFKEENKSFVATYIPKFQKPTVLQQKQEARPSQRLKKNSKFFSWFLNRSRVKRDEFQAENRKNMKFFRRVWIFVPSLVIFAIFLYQHIALAGALYLKYIPYVDTYYLLKQAQHQNYKLKVAKTLINVEQNSLHR